MDNLKYRYVASPRDSRDWIYSPTVTDIPAASDLRQWDSLVEDQGYLGSCSGQALSSAYELLLKKTDSSLLDELSEMFIYYNARVIDDIVEIDGGANIRSALDGLRFWGVCRDQLWPYDITKFNIRPPQECYDDAKQRIISWYNRIEIVEQTKNAIAEGWPVVIGTEIWSSLWQLNSENNIMTIDGYNLGYHAMVIVGYDDTLSQYTVKNSWGTEWGMNGYCYMPYDYMNNYVYERWIFDYRSETGETKSSLNT